MTKQLQACAELIFNVLSSKLLSLEHAMRAAGASAHPTTDPSMKGVILADGSCTRLYPLTLMISKQIVLMDGKLPRLSVKDATGHVLQTLKSMPNFSSVSP